MIYDTLRSLMPAAVSRYVMHFEAAIEDAVSAFAAGLSHGWRVLDAGAGEGAHKHYFPAQRYCGVDLAVGDQTWDYSRLDVLGDLETLPFPDRTFEAAINIVTLEHVLHPAKVLCELSRVLAGGGRLLLVAPLEWEEHQQPHDYGRFTRYALDHLLRQAGFTDIAIQPVGGIFRLISRRLLNALQYFPGPLIIVAAVFFAPPALLLPLLDPLGLKKSFYTGIYMFRAQAFLIALLPALASAAGVSGASALEFTRRAVAFGPRPSGSEAIHQLQAYIQAQLKTCKCQVTEDAFTPQTPKGPIAMKNILAKFPGKSGKAVVITGHYDTKLFPGRKFVGASDGGSSAGLLLELARVLAGQPRTDDVYLVWLDGEEAVRTEWAGQDNLYGSRHLAELWSKDGTAAKIKGLINVDMIGDKHLNIKQEQNSNARLRQLVWKSAADLGYQAYFVNDTITIEDDHMEFLKRGIPALDLIDFDYEPWHTDEDTMDKLSAQSLEIVGTVVLDSIQRLERQ